MLSEAIPLFPAGIPGGTELVVILLIAVLLFGANKIPKLARSTGQAMGEFQKGRQQVEEELEAMQDGVPVDEEGNIVDTDESAGPDTTGSTDATTGSTADATADTTADAESASAQTSETSDTTSSESETTSDAA